MKSTMSRTAPFLGAIALAGAIGLALPALAAPDAAPSTAAEKTDSEAPAAKPASVGGVTVQAPRPPSKLGQIPPDKKAELDAEAAKNEAWKRYRKSTPPLAAGTLGQAADYPGLQTLLPQPDAAAPASPAAVR